MKRLYTDTDLRLRMGAAARRRARSPDLYWPKKAEKMDALYREVCGGK